MTPTDLLPQVYEELRRLAAAKLAGQPTGQTLDATALVHEAWLKLNRADFEAKSPSHFLAVAAMAMRQILVDRARAQLTRKRDGGRRVTLIEVEQPLDDDQVLALNELLDRFAREYPDHARLVELRFFGGLSAEQAADAMDISKSTADRLWRFARAWLDVELARD